MFRDALELSQPLAQEAMAVLAVVGVGVSDDELVLVCDGEVAVDSVVLLDVQSPA